MNEWEDAEHLFCLLIISKKKNLFCLQLLDNFFDYMKAQAEKENKTTQQQQQTSQKAVKGENFFETISKKKKTSLLEPTRASGTYKPNVTKHSSFEEPDTHTGTIYSKQDIERIANKVNNNTNLVNNMNISNQANIGNVNANSNSPNPNTPTNLNANSNSPNPNTPTNLNLNTNNPNPITTSANSNTPTNINANTTKLDNNSPESNLSSPNRSGTTPLNTDANQTQSTIKQLIQISLASINHMRDFLNGSMEALPSYSVKQVLLYTTILNEMQKIWAQTPDNERKVVPKERIESLVNDRYQILVIQIDKAIIITLKQAAIKGKPFHN